MAQGVTLAERPASTVSRASRSIAAAFALRLQKDLHSALLNFIPKLSGVNLLPPQQRFRTSERRQRVLLRVSEQVLRLRLMSQQQCEGIIRLRLPVALCTLACLCQEVYGLLLRS